MNNQVTIIKYCGWCGDPFEVKSPNQKYCSLSERIVAKKLSVRVGAKPQINIGLSINMF